MVVCEIKLNRFLYILMHVTNYQFLLNPFICLTCKAFQSSLTNQLKTPLFLSYCLIYLYMYL